MFKLRARPRRALDHQQSLNYLIACMADWLALMVDSCADTNLGLKGLDAESRAAPDRFQRRSKPRLC